MKVDLPDIYNAATTFLMEHPSVLEAAVTGQAGQDGLTKSKAYVVLKGECQPSEKLKEELPKTATGKIQRFKL